jgi:hypothetical protein
MLRRSSASLPLERGVPGLVEGIVKTKAEGLELGREILRLGGGSLKPGGGSVGLGGGPVRFGAASVRFGTVIVARPQARDRRSFATG